MAREDLHFRLRIPESLKDQVEKAAEENRRSMTAEILARLERSFDDDGYADLDGRIDRLEASMSTVLERLGLYDPNG